MYALLEAAKIVEEIFRKKEIMAVTIFTDSQAAVRRIQSDQPGLGQVSALRMM